MATALEVMGAHLPGGWPAIRASNHDLALAGRRVLLEALGAPVPAPDAMIGSIASVQIPPDGSPTRSTRDPLVAALQTNWSIEVPVPVWPVWPHRLLRISAQQYNAFDDYRTLRHAVVSELART